MVDKGTLIKQTICICFLGMTTVIAYLEMLVFFPFLYVILMDVSV